jgi:hypothetical protein
VGSQGEECSGSGTSMTLVTGYRNREGETMGCSHFQRGRGGGGEVAPRCHRQMTQRRAAAGIWRSIGRMRGWIKLLTGLVKKYG